MIFEMEHCLLDIQVFSTFVCLFVFFQDRVSRCISGCSATLSVYQAGLKLRDPPASSSQVLGLKSCTTTAGLHFFFNLNTSFARLIQYFHGKTGVRVTSVLL